jgi:hypothetical protein
MSNQPWDTKQMFEYLRDDLNANREENRALANETNRKIDKLTDMLSTHVSDDAKNFKEISERLGCIEITDQTKDRVKDRSWGRFTGWAVALAAWVHPLIMYFRQ